MANGYFPKLFPGPGSGPPSHSHPTLGLFLYPEVVPFPPKPAQPGNPSQLAQNGQDSLPASNDSAKVPGSQNPGWAQQLGTVQASTIHRLAINSGDARPPAP